MQQKVRDGVGKRERTKQEWNENDGFLRTAAGYLREYLRVIGLWLCAAVCFAVVFYLYELPLEAVFYALLLSGVFFSLAAVPGFISYIRRHRVLSELRTRVTYDRPGVLPQPKGQIEKDYSRLVQLLLEDRARILSKEDSLRTEMTDYYTAWVHQIKTPIAAMRLLLQSETQFSRNDFPGKDGKIAEHTAGTEDAKNAADMEDAENTAGTGDAENTAGTGDAKNADGAEGESGRESGEKDGGCRENGELQSLREELLEELLKTEQYVDMVLQYLRLGSSSSDFLFREYDLDGILRQAIRKFSGMFIRKRLALNYEETGVSAVTDEKWFLFVVEQILSNALKYTPSGSISIYVEEEGQRLVIADTGIGIEPEDLARVFEKGFTGYNGRRDKKSTGIGLYLSKRIMDRLAHSLEIESAPGEGTKVKIGLRRYELRPE